MLLSNDLQGRLKNFLTKLPPVENKLELMLTHLINTDKKILRYSLGKSSLTDSFCGHIITANSDIQYHFYYSSNHFTRIELVDIMYPEDFEVIYLE